MLKLEARPQPSQAMALASPLIALLITVAVGVLLFQPQQGRVFMMREVVELETQEICSELGLSTSNVHVILHRARLALRSCLQNHWFQEGA